MRHQLARTIEQYAELNQLAIFIVKLAIVIEECDEAQYWLELMKDQALIEEDRFMNLHGEANDLTAIFVASRKTAVANGPKRQ